MKTYTQQRQTTSDTVQPKASKQASAHDVLQAYKDKIVQRQDIDEDELLQGKFNDTVQLEEFDEDELLQGKFDTAQREEIDEDELLQGKFEASTVQREEIPPSGGGGANKTGMPDNLKNGIEALSGYSMDDVRVHYNSPKPAQLQALAYAQGTDIHVAPGQEQHLPHEAWHVVQQKQGRVQPTMQLQGVNVNDNEGLEKEADVIQNLYYSNTSTKKTNIIQRKIRFSESKNPYDALIEEASFNRPNVKAPSKLSNYHITAMSVFQLIAEFNVLGCNYIGALKNLRFWINNLDSLPGMNEKILKSINGFNVLIYRYLNDGNCLNWGNNIDVIAEEAIKIRNHIEYTYHKKGSGDVTENGEKKSLEILIDQMLKYHYNAYVLANAIFGLIDARNCKIPDKISNEDRLKYVEYYLTIWHQHILTLIDAYPQLNDNKYCKVINWAYTLFSNAICGLSNLKNIVPKEYRSQLDEYPYPLQVLYQ